MKEMLFLRSIEEHRRVMARVSSSCPCAKNVEIIKERSLVIYRPKVESSVTQLYPTIFFLPGTAFVARETAFTDVICSYISSYSNSQVICINHGLAPEFKFPKAHTDAYKIFKEVFKAEEKYKVDKSKIAIMGYSSGGNFATLLALAASQDGIKLARQVLISPCLDLSRSILDFKNDEMQDTTISEGFVTWFLNHYIPANVAPRDPAISPFWLSKEMLQILPATDIIVANHDRFRGDSEAFSSRLTSAGINVEKYQMLGDHSFLWINMEISKFIGLKMKAIFGGNQMPEYPLLVHSIRLVSFKSKSTSKQDEKIFPISSQQLQILLNCGGIDSKNLKIS